MNKEMTLEEILDADVKRNYPPGTDVGELIANINDELRQGGELTRHNNTVIVYRPVEPGIVEHHSFNADTPQNLLDANVKLWEFLQKAKAKEAYTTYTNPKINDLLKQVPDKFKISIDQDPDGVFTAKVAL